MTRPKSLRIAPTLQLPLDAVTSTFGILAKKGAGKSNAAVVMAEEMFDAGVPWVAIDPKGDWWGVRSSGDGTGPGLPVVVFGGQHGDVPLEPTAGKVLANLVLEHRLTCVVDVSELTKGEVRRFLDAFGDALYRGARAEPLHVFLEEAHEYLPQTVRNEDAGMVERWQKIVKMGRTKGLGVTIVSQRSAAVNKDVLTQCDTLIVLRTTSPQDRAAVKAWVDVHADAGEALRSLPSLANGEAWVWYPEGDEQLQRIRFRQRRTFDSGATPKVGAAQRAPARLADVDLDAIKEQMAETIEKAKADDPAELRRKVVHLEKSLLQRERELADAINAKPAEVVHVEVQRLPQGSRLAAATILEHGERLVGALRDLSRVMDKYEEDTHVDRRPDIPRAGRAGNGAGAVATPRPAQRPDPPAGRQPSRAPVPRVETTNGKLGKRERLILSVLAQHPNGRTFRQLALLTGYSAKASTIGAGLSELRKLGYVGTGNPIHATDEGMAAIADSVEPLPTGPALLEYWRGQLGKRERLILDALVDAYPDTLDHAAVCEATGYSPEASTVGAGMSKLRGLELVEGWRASDDFMDAIA